LQFVSSSASPPSKPENWEQVNRLLHFGSADVRALEGAPNVVIVLLDAMDFGQASVCGGPIHMPTLDTLAAWELCYNNSPETG